MLLSAVLVVIGVALIARTIAAGGGALAIGVIFGVLCIVAGGARLYVHYRLR
jgi:hypothetical protein